MWIGNDNTPASARKRQPFFLLAPDVPTRFKGLSIIDTTTNQYLAFDTTSPEKDVSDFFTTNINLKISIILMVMEISIDSEIYFR